MSSAVDIRELRRAAMAAMILEQQQEDADRARGLVSQRSQAEQQDIDRRVREATSSTLTWLTKYTRTVNPHWKEQGLESAYLPFPDWDLIPVLLEYLEDDSEKVKLIEKSRTMMVTWVIMGYFTLQAMLVPEREVVVQTMTEDKGELPIDYAKCLYQSQPEWLRNEFPLPKPVDKQSANELRFSNGSVIFGIPAGIGKIRSYHPWGYFNDETAFQPDAATAYDEALPAAKKIVLNSTAAPSWFFNFTSDIDA